MEWLTHTAFAPVSPLITAPPPALPLKAWERQLFFTAALKKTRNRQQQVGHFDAGLSTKKKKNNKHVPVWFGTCN